jgi:hypothetical protein
VWISADRFALLKVRETEVIDHIRFDAWGLLGNDPIENERITICSAAIMIAWLPHVE